MHDSTNVMLTLPLRSPISQTSSNADAPPTGFFDMGYSHLFGGDNLTKFHMGVPGVIGCIQALEAIKIAADVREPLSRRILLLCQGSKFFLLPITDFLVPICDD